MVWLKTITITNNISFISKNYTFASRAPGGFFVVFKIKMMANKKPLKIF